MYSRKQFLFAAAGKCFDFIKSCNSFLSLQNEDQRKGSAELIPQSLFLEAISFGLDPGTMASEQLIRTVNRLKANSNRNESL